MSCGRPNFLSCGIRKMLSDVISELGEPVILKLVASSSPGDPAKGEGRTYTFTMKPTRAVIDSVEQNDILYSGGIYQIGDIKVQMKEKLREVVDTVGHIGDRIIWQHSEYRVFGKPQPETLNGQTFLWRYTFRKVDDKPQ